LHVSATIGTITGIVLARIVMQAYRERLVEGCWPYVGALNTWQREYAAKEARQRVVARYYLDNKVQPV
jgi:hypothetical protein